MGTEKSIGLKIFALRKEKGVTQAELGAYLNISYQAVSKWERDESCPDFATMLKIAKYFNVSLDYFETGEKKSLNDEAKEEKREEEGIVCPFCGKKTSAEERFCVHCDGFLGQSSAKTGKKTAVKQNTQKQKPVKMCAACSCVMPIDAFWCPNCHSIAGSRETAQDRNKKTGARNGWAIAAIICVGLMGLIFAIIGLVRSRKTGTGRTLSIVALVLSCVWVLACIIVLVEMLDKIGNGYYYYYY